MCKKIEKVVEIEGALTALTGGWPTFGKNANEGPKLQPKCHGVNV